METKKYQAFWQGAIILTLASLIMKVLSAFYRIPYQNIAGDIGFYIYQQVYPVYGICLVLATYGFPVVISKLVASRLEKGNEQEANGIIFISFWFLMMIGSGLFFVFFFGSHAIAVFMGDEKLDKLLKVVSFSFLLMPFLSVARGYFQGFGNMTPTAVSQVIEQTIRVAVIVLLSLLLVAAGFDSYTVGAGAMSGSVVGGAISVMILLYFLRNKIKEIFAQTWSAIPDKSLIIKLVFWQGIMICVSNLVLILIQLVDSISLYSLLVATGETGTKAKIIKGVYDRGIPLIQLGTVAATSFALPLVPLISGARVRGDYVFIQKKIQFAMKLTLVIGLAATGGLVCIIRPVNIMLFQNSDGSDLLAVLAISIIFSAFSITTSTVLQGLGNTTLPAFFVLIGAIVKYIGNRILIPDIGALGAAAATVLALFCIAFLNIAALRRKMHQPLFNWRNIGNVIFSCIGMILCVTIYTYLFEHLLTGVHSGHRGAASLEALTAAASGGVMYIFLIFKLQIFTEEEIGIVWKGGKVPLLPRSNRP
ncbi:putative polysaccharide biosynthesis protein [Ectobacillus panaciterrae]|uniref:putative polysaccharide biosynthesis protein n=1 Tax=Ectobacillus panaciterrae TaxID=363872 RepID=UPI00040257EB|nr:polysaccharide biosynthesis protein [Ectobacillus panaciterrae]